MSRIALTCALIVLSLVVAMTPAARATIQDESCVYPDVEYPIPCDDDDD